MSQIIIIITSTLVSSIRSQTALDEGLYSKVSNLISRRKLGGKELFSIHSKTLDVLHLHIVADVWCVDVIHKADAVVVEYSVAGGKEVKVDELGWRPHQPLWEVEHGALVFEVVYESFQFACWSRRVSLGTTDGWEGNWRGRLASKCQQTFLGDSEGDKEDWYANGREEDLVDSQLLEHYLDAATREKTVQRLIPVMAQGTNSESRSSEMSSARFTEVLLLAIRHLVTLLDHITSSWKGHRNWHICEQ